MNLAMNGQVKVELKQEEYQNELQVKKRDIELKAKKNRQYMQSSTP